MRLSDTGKACLADREGMRLKAYQDERGIWTIGLGHTSSAGPPKVTPNLAISEDQAWEIFHRDVQKFADQVRPHFKAELEQHEYDALVSFIYNIGPPGFIKSTVLKRLNAGDKAGAADALLMWMKPSSLKTRRYGEYWQFKGGKAYARADEKGNRVG